MTRCLVSVLAAALTIPAVPPDAIAQWVRITGPIHGIVHALTFNGENLIAGTTSGVFRCTEAGGNWEVVDSALMNRDVRCFAGGMLSIVAGTWGSGVFLSTDSGITWAPGDSVLTGGNIYSLAGSLARFYVSTNTGGFFSTDYGLHWTAAPPWVPSWPPYRIMNALEFTPPYLETAVQGLFGGTDREGIFLSTDSGITWIAVNDGLPPPMPILEIGYPSITALAFAGTNLIAGTDAGVFLSTGIGGHWTACDSSWIMGGVYCLAARGLNTFAGTSRGLFYSSDRGKAWIRVDSGLGDARVCALALSQTDLFAATFGGTLWRRPLAEMVTAVSDSHDGKPGLFRLEQNYPNPFNPSTTIRYALADRARVTLVVFTVLGERVATLVDEVQEAGTHDARFDASGLSSGAYFYRLRAEGFVQTREMHVVK